MRGLKLLLLIIAIPVVSMVASRAVLNQYESEWRQMVVEAVGPVESEKIADLQTLCTRPDARAELADLCLEVDKMDWLFLGALGSLGLGLVLVALIWIMGRLAGSRREMLWRVYGPGLRITLGGVALMVILNGALGMATIWYGEGALTGTVHTGIMWLIGIGALTGVATMVRSTMAAVSEVSSKVLGQPVSRSEEPDLWSLVDSTASRLGTESPHNIITGLLPTFFVTETDVEHPSGLLLGRTLYVSLPLCRILSHGELAAVIGHELGHFRGADTAFSQKFYPIYRGSQEALVALVRSGGGTRSIALLPAIYTLGFFLDSFATAESGVSREREFLADQAGASGAGSRAMASALVKIHAFGKAWDEVLGDLAERIRRGERHWNASLLFSEFVGQRATPDSLQGLDKLQVPHPTDSHPPLSQRLTALGYDLSTLTEESLQVMPGEPAIGLFRRAEEWENLLSGMEQKRLAVIPGLLSKEA